MSDDTRDYIIEEMRSIDSSVKEVQSKINDLDKTLVEYKVSFQHHVSVDEDMYSELKRMNDILASNTESLKVHIRRTELLEDIAVKLGNRLTSLEIRQIEEKAVQKWVSNRTKLMVQIATAVIGIIGAMATAPSVIAWIHSLMK